MLYRIDSYRHMYILLFRICCRYVPIPVSFLWTLNSSNLLIELSYLWLLGFHMCPCFQFPSNLNILVKDLFLASHCFWKGTCTFGCSACASVICYLLLKLPSCTLVCGILWTFARNGKGSCEPLPEMVKGVMHRACDALPAPSDFT